MVSGVYANTFSSKMLQLDTNLFIGKGALRSVYHHPAKPNLCVKINYKGDTGTALLRQKREIKLYRKLERKFVFFYHISRFVGIEETNLGRGYIYEKVNNEDGAVSQDLHEVLKENKGNIELLSAIQKMGEFLLKNRIFFHDGLLRGNTLCSKRLDSSYRLVIVDALGDTVLIPILNYIPACANRRIIKKWNKYMVNPILKNHPWVKRSQICLSIENKSVDPNG